LFTGFYVEFNLKWSGVGVCNGIIPGLLDFFSIWIIHFPNCFLPPGGITVYFNFGTQSGGQQTISTETLEQGVDLTNNQQHIVQFRRIQGGRKLILQVQLILK
jgi:hypothetical protein